MGRGRQLTTNERSPGPLAARGGPQVIPRPVDAIAGAPAPWAGAVQDGWRPDLDGVRRALETRTPLIEPRSSSVPDIESAVLVPLYETDDEVHVILTTRTTAMRSHSGQVSFPGGRREQGEPLVETALREAREEVDLDPGVVTVIGQLDGLSTWSNQSSIAAFVGILDGRPALKPNPDEVARILHVPVSELLAPGVYREELWPVPDATRPLWFFELVGDTVWGVTAAFLRQLLVLLLES